MKIKTGELQDGALNWAVAKILNLPISLHKGVVFVDNDPFMPESFWYQGGPIIERENICVNRDNSCYEWEAYLVQEDKKYGGIERVEAYGLTPLIAAMRCYVSSKLGAECDIPDELITGDYDDRTI